MPLEVLGPVHIERREESRFVAENPILQEVSGLMSMTLTDNSIYQKMLLITPPSARTAAP